MYSVQYGVQARWYCGERAVEVLLQHGARVDGVHGQRQSPFEEAVQQHSYTIAALLFSEYFRCWGGN
jgi:hypothetical protein